MSETPKEPVVNIGNAPRERSYSRYYKEEKREEPPLLFEPLKAYRHWRINAGRLWTPIHGHFEWGNDDNEAVCEAKGVKASQCLAVDCHCGFYSVWNRGGDYAFKDPRGTNTICGVIEIYGKVVIGSSGARASNARVVALWLPSVEVQKWTPFSRGRNHLMRNYPDVRFYRSHDNLVAQEGVKAPRHLFNSYVEYGGYG